MPKRTSIAIVAITLIGCGEDKKAPDPTAAKATQEQTAAAAKPVDVAPLPLGVSSPTALNYSYGKGAAAYKRAVDATEKKDWVAVKSASQETLAADGTHLDAHRSLATAMAQQGEYEDALEHLRIALAGDWIRWGFEIETDADLEPLRSSPLGPKLAEMIAAYREEFARRARAGLLVVARRSGFKPPQVDPKKKGDARTSSRAEVFAYDAELKRYLRLTQTGFQVVAVLPSISGDEIAYVTLARVTPAAAGDTGGAIMSEAKVGTLLFASPELKNREATFKGARSLTLEYRAGDELVVTVAGKGGDKSFTVDRASGKTKATRAPAPGGRRLIVRHEEVVVTAPPADGVAADWNPDTGTTEELVIDASKKRVQLPAGQAAVRSSTTWSADRSRLAFATAADPCSDDPAGRQSALYVVEAESGMLKHVASAAAHFSPRFVDAAVLAFQDDEENVRLFDAAAGRETTRLKGKGISLVGLGASATPVCWTKKPPEPPPAAPAPESPPPENHGDAEGAEGDAEKK